MKFLTWMAACLTIGTSLAEEPAPSVSIYSRPSATVSPGGTSAGGAPSGSDGVLASAATEPSGTEIDATASVDPGDGDPSGRAERIVAACLAGLCRETSISARMRQRVRVGDHMLVGSGLYEQAGLGEQQRFRFESVLTTDAVSNRESGSFFTVEQLEVCDGAIFWTYERRGEYPVEVQRVDVARVRQQVEKLTGLRSPDAPAITPHLGGIQRMLAWLRHWFQFASADSAEIDGMPIWLVEGRWNPALLAALLPKKAEAIKAGSGLPAEELPDGMPWSVRLSIGKRALFPLRFEYLAIPGPRPTSTRQPEVVAVLELYEVQLGEPVDPTAFVYAPATEQVVDTTDRHIVDVFPLRP